MIGIYLLFHYFLRFVFIFFQVVGILFLGMLVLLFEKRRGFIVLFHILFLLGFRLIIIRFLVFDQIILFGPLFQVQLICSYHQVSNLIYLKFLLLILSSNFNLFGESLFQVWPFLTALINLLINLMLLLLVLKFHPFLFIWLLSAMLDREHA